MAPFCDSQPQNRTAVDIAIVDRGGYALLSDGTVWCWSMDPTSACPDDDGLPSQILDVPCFTAIAAGAHDFVGIARDGELWIRGALTVGELRRIAGGVTWANATYDAVAWGDGSRAWWWGAPSNFQRAPTEPSAFPYWPAEYVAFGAGYSCFLAGGGLACFGRNDVGQLGNKTVSESQDAIVEEPQPVAIPGAVHLVVLDSARSFALDDASNVWTWGGTPRASEPEGATPTIWSAVSPAVGVSRTSTAGCSRNETGDVLAWGNNPLNLLVYVDPDVQPPLHTGDYEPLRLHDLEPAVKVQVGGDGPLCALKRDGTVWCRGQPGSIGTFHHDDASAAQVLFKDSR